MDHSPTALETFSPTTAEELARFVAENSVGDRRPLFAVGGRTALHYGYPRVEGDITISLGELSRVVDYPARDMTISVEAGLRVEELQKVLAAEGQRLPVDVPQAHRATIGGAIATNTSGPGRFGHGTLRDYVIGISAVDGRGRLFSAGGRVVKNVAGYDLCKLLVGSLGTLAIITQVTLKLRPLAAARQCLWGTFADPGSIDAALQRLMVSETRPVAIEVLNSAAVHQILRESKLELPADRYVLCLAYEGGEHEVAWEIDTARQELAAHNPEDLVAVPSDQSQSLWSALCEYQAASDDPLTFQANIPPAAAMDLLQQATDRGVAVQCHAGNGVTIGHLPDRCSTPQKAAGVLEPLRAQCEQQDGSLLVLACDDEWKTQLSLFGRRRPAGALEARVKAALDPHNLLSPGRLGQANIR
jgi:glycolate oxidase FAD binding subunit